MCLRTLFRSIPDSDAGILMYPRKRETSSGNLSATNTEYTITVSRAVCIRRPLQQKCQNHLQTTKYHIILTIGQQFIIRAENRLFSNEEDTNEILKIIFIHIQNILIYFFPAICRDINNICYVSAVCKSAENIIQRNKYQKPVLAYTSNFFVF